MNTPQIGPIAEHDRATQQLLLELNNAHERETSHLTRQDWRALIDRAFAALCADGAAALLVAIDSAADYHNVNFNWFRDRYADFVYVDRVIVADACRGHGIARLLYERLFDLARGSGHQRIVCEVNIDPPNPGSDAFHKSLGFTEVGRAELSDRNKTVRYLMKNIDTSTPR